MFFFKRIIIDSRPSSLFRISHIPNSINIPIDQLKKQLEWTNFKFSSIHGTSKLHKLDHITIYSETGCTSKRGYFLLKSWGFLNVKEISGGFKEWQAKHQKFELNYF